MLLIILQFLPKSKLIQLQPLPLLPIHFWSLMVAFIVLSLIHRSFYTLQNLLIILIAVLFSLFPHLLYIALMSIIC